MLEGITKGKINTIYIIPLIFSVLFILGANYRTTLTGDEVEYVSIAESISGGKGVMLFELPTTISFTWPAFISPLFNKYFSIWTSILLGRILTMMLMIISLFQITYILRKIKIGSEHLSTEKILLIQIFTFGNFYFWNVPGTLYTGPFSIVVLLFICILLLNEKFNVAQLLLIGFLSSLLVSTKYITCVVYPALFIHFTVSYGFNKKTISKFLIICLAASVILIPVFIRFINLEFFTEYKFKFSYLKDFNERIEQLPLAEAFLVQIGKGLYNFSGKFHEYFTTINDFDAIYLSVIFFAPIIVFLYKNIKTKFTFSFISMFTIIYMFVLILIGYGGNTRYWLSVFPFLCLFFIEGISGLKFFEKEIFFDKVKAVRASKIFMYLMLSAFTLLYIILRFSEADLLRIKFYTLLVSFATTVSMLVFYLLNNKRIYLWNLTILVLLVLPFSRGLNEYLLLRRPAPADTIMTDKDRIDLCRFLDSSHFEYPIFQKTDVVNPSWSTAYSNTSIFYLEAKYDIDSLSKIYLINRDEYHYDYLEISGIVYDITEKKIIYSNRHYMVLELNLKSRP